MCAFNRKDVNILVYVYNRLLTICCLILIISCNKQPVSAQQRVSLEDAINNYVFNTSIVKKSKLKYNNIKLEYDKFLPCNWCYVNTNKFQSKHDSFTELYDR